MKTGDSLYISLLPYCAISLRDTFLSAVLLTDFCYVQNSMADEDRHPSTCCSTLLGDSAFPFVCGLISMFYGLSMLERTCAVCAPSSAASCRRQEGYQMIAGGAAV